MREGHLSNTSAIVVFSLVRALLLTVPSVWKHHQQTADEKCILTCSSTLIISETFEFDVDIITENSGGFWIILSRLWEASRQ